MILRIRNFEKFQGHVKHDWPWRKFWRVPSATFAAMPGYVRGYAKLLVLLANKQGDIELGHREWFQTLCRLLVLHRDERRMFRRALDLLLADAFVLRVEHADDEPDGARREHAAYMPRARREHAVNTPQTCREHAGDIPTIVTPGNDSPSDPKFRQIREEKIREEESITRPPPGPAPLQVLSGSTASPDGMVVKAVERTESAAAKATREARAFAAEALAYMSEKSGRRLSVTEGRVKSFKRLIADGHSMNEWKVVVWSKTLGPKKWLGDEKMDEHVTPETFLRPSNFPKYLEQATREYVAFDAGHAEELGLVAPTTEAPKRAPAPANERTGAGPVSFALALVPGGGDES